MNGKERKERGEDRHLWQIQPVRDVFWILLGVGLFWLAYQVRNILIPILIGLTLAYLVNPLITWMKRRWGVSRWLSIALIFALVLLAGTGAGLFMGPLIRDQVTSLVERVPEYYQLLQERYGLRLEEVAGSLAESLPEQLRAGDGEGSLLEVVRRILGTTTNIVLWVILIPIYFAFFSWHFQRMVEEGRHLLSAERHPRAVEILRRMDEAVGTFFRARLLICFIIGIVFSVGWWLAQVPYWFLLGAVTGLLSIVPYLSILGWLLALLVKYLDMAIGPGAPGFGWMTVLLWPTIVFWIGNFVEAWILTPLIHGRTTQLSPVTILTIVLVGGGLGGFWGLLLAIPVAICLDILAREFLWPRFKAGER